MILEIQCRLSLCSTHDDVFTVSFLTFTLALERCFDLTFKTSKQDDPVPPSRERHDFPCQEFRAIFGHLIVIACFTLLPPHIDVVCPSIAAGPSHQQKPQPLSVGSRLTPLLFQSQYLVRALSKPLVKTPISTYTSCKESSSVLTFQTRKLHQILRTRRRYFSEKWCFVWISLSLCCRGG